MGKTKAALAGRAWRLLRVALLWARKGGLFKRGQLQELRLVMHHHFKSLRGAARSDAIHAGEREFSLDETPIFHFRMGQRPKSARMLLHIPCINPPVDFDDVDDDDEFHFDRRHRRASCRRWGDAYEAEDEEESAEDGDAGNEPDCEVSAADRVRGGEEKEDQKCVDMKAEEFIAKFYAQVKLQRQISLLQYNEMLLRSAN